MTLRDRFDLGRLEPFWQSVTLWWTGRSLREQILLGVLAAMAIFALLLLSLVPLREARMEALADIRSAALLEARLRNGGGNAIGAYRTGTASAIVTNSAATAQLQVQEIGDQGDNVSVVLADAPFDKVVTWIADVEQTSGLRLRDATIQRQGAAGFVTAELVFGS